MWKLGVWQGEGAGGGGDPGYRIKNKNPTQSCGEKWKSGTPRAECQELPTQPGLPEGSTSAGQGRKKTPEQKNRPRTCTVKTLLERFSLGCSRSVARFLENEKKVQKRINWAQQQPKNTPAVEDAAPELSSSWSIGSSSSFFKVCMRFTDDLDLPILDQAHGVHRVPHWTVAQYLIHCVVLIGRGLRQLRLVPLCVWCWSWSHRALEDINWRFQTGRRGRQIDHVPRRCSPSRTPHGWPCTAFHVFPSRFASFDHVVPSLHYNVKLLSRELHRRGFSCCSPWRRWCPWGIGQNSHWGSVTGFPFSAILMVKFLSPNLRW